MIKVKPLFSISLLAAISLTISGCDTVQAFVSNLGNTENNEETQQVASAESNKPDEAPKTVTYYPAKNPAWSKLDVGTLTCNQGIKFHVKRADVGNNIDIIWKGKDYTLHNIKTASGAFRYEDAASGLVFIQVPAKVLLLDSKVGQRLADECKP